VAKPQARDDEYFWWLLPPNIRHRALAADCGISAGSLMLACSLFSSPRVRRYLRGITRAPEINLQILNLNKTSSLNWFYQTRRKTSPFMAGI